MARSPLKEVCAPSSMSRFDPISLLQTDIISTSRMDVVRPPLLLLILLIPVAWATRTLITRKLKGLEDIIRACSHLIKFP